MSDDADYAPAIETTAGSDDAGSDDPNDAVTDAAPKEVAEVHEPRRAGRQISDSVRAMFKTIAKQHDGGDLETGDLVPVVTETKRAAKPAAATSEEDELVPVDTETAAAKVAAKAAPVAAQPAAPKHDAALMVERAAFERDRIAHTDAVAALERDKAALADERAALAERSKALPDRNAWIERPGATLMTHLRDMYGTADETELKDVLTDLVTELSEQGLGVKLPADIKMAMESRKAVRAVKAYKQDLTREQQKIAEARTAAETASRLAREEADIAAKERKAHEQVTGLVNGARDEFPFLHDQDDPGTIVFQVIKEQIARAEKAGEAVKIDWKAAAKLADDHFKAQAEETVKKAERLRTKLNPTAPATAPAKATTAASPGATPGSVAKPQTKPTPATETVDIDEANSQPMDRHERRAAQARALRGKYFPSVGT